MEEKRKRSANFTFEEKLLLMTIVSQKYYQVEDKKTDRTSIEEKIKIWKMIEKEFNSTSRVSLFRSWDTLKRFYENRKKEVRKLKARDTQNQLKTGGGPEVKTELDTADEILLSVMNEKTVSGIQSFFDSYTDLSQITQSNNSEVQFIFHSDDVEEVIKQRSVSLENDSVPGMSTGNGFVISEKSSILLDKTLYPATCNEIENECVIGEKSSVSVDKALMPETINETQNLVVIGEKRKHCDWKVPSDLQKPVNPALKRSVMHKATPSTSRRRPTQTIKTLSSSSIAEKYILLLDRRLTLVLKQIQQIDEDREFLRTKRKLELELLTLEIATKKNVTMQ